MAVYKEEKTNTWRVLYRYTDWNGERKQSQKRGFQTKREAQAWEREQLNKVGNDLDMTCRFNLRLTGDGNRAIDLSCCLFFWGKSGTKIIPAILQFKMWHGIMGKNQVALYSRRSYRWQSKCTFELMMICTKN